MPGVCRWDFELNILFYVGRVTVHVYFCDYARFSIIYICKCVLNNMRRVESKYLQSLLFELM